jgi:bifunctional non-homologous end joining protein LigD
MHRVGKSGIAQAAKEKPAYLYAFDCLFLDGKKLVTYPLEQRRAWLAAILRTGNTIRLSDTFPDGNQLFAAAKAMGLEGVMAKQKQSRYTPGNRSGAWLKIKFRETFEAYIIGYTQGKGDRSGWFGALHLAQQNEQGNWKYFGKVGTGFDMEMIHEIMPRLTALETISKPIKDAVEEENRTIWVVPQWMCEVTFASFASTGNLREPVFLKMWEANTE